MREGRNEAGVPILNQLPYINRLFRNTGIGREAESLMMMVTPRIIIQEEEEELRSPPGTSNAGRPPSLRGDRRLGWPANLFVDCYRVRVSFSVLSRRGIAGTTAAFCAEDASARSRSARGIEFDAEQCPRSGVG